MIGLIVALSSCSTIQVSQDFDAGYNFTSAKTYNWNKNLTVNDDDLIQKDELLAKRFFDAINHNLQFRGYSLADSPELLVSCTFTVTSRLQTDTIQPAIGVGYGRYGRYGGVGVHSGTSVRQYDRGMLAINIHSKLDNKLVWKGTGTREVFTHNSPEKISEIVAELVQSVLEQFPPST